MNQKNFFLGLVSGIAIISFVGFIIMTVAYFQKSQDLSQTKNGNEPVAKEKNVAGPAQNQNSNAGAGQKADIKVTDQDWIRGDKNAPVTIVEFSDFQCPYCARFHQTMKEVMQNYPNQVRWVFKFFPLSQIHPYAQKAAEAAECAGEQGKFWDYADNLFENQDSFSDDFFSQAASRMGLNMNKFNSCVTDSKTAEKVDADLAQGQAAGVQGTPTSFINGQAVPGALPYDQLKSTIDGLLNK